MKASKSIFLGVALVACLLVASIEACSEAAARRKVDALLRAYPNLANEVRDGKIGGGQAQTTRTINVDQTNLRPLDDNYVNKLRNINSNKIQDLRDLLDK